MSCNLQAPTHFQDKPKKSMDESDYEESKILTFRDLSGLSYLTGDRFNHRKLEEEIGNNSNYG